MQENQFSSAVKSELSFIKNISLGTSGVSARRVQEWLSYHECATAIDGDFGTATGQAVQKFQRQNALPETGSVDQQTWSALTAPLRSALDDGVGTTLGDRLLSIAQQHLRLNPRELGGDNRGPWVRIYTGGHDGPEWRWCAGFVTFLLKQASLETNMKMPFKGSLSCDTLAAQSQDAGLFVAEKELKGGKIEWDELGKIFLFLVRRTPGDYTHVGIGLGGSEQGFNTIEGNTNDSGSPNGYEVCARIRSAASKDFIYFKEG
jgi:hypothetical protein